MTRAATVRDVKAARHRRAVAYRDLVHAVRLGFSSEKNLDKYLPRLGDD